MTEVVGNGKDLHIPKNIAELAVLNGMPADQAKRVVVIAQRPLKALQSGQRLSHQWQITWKQQARWSNPLMGWTSTADPMSNLKLNFETQEDAIAFAQRNGWSFEVQRETSKKNTPAGTYLYKHNFLDKRVSRYKIIFDISHYFPCVHVIPLYRPPRPLQSMVTSKPFSKYPRTESRIGSCH